MPAFEFLMSNEDPKKKCEVVKDNNGYDCIAGINAQWYGDAVERIKALPLEARLAAVATFVHNLYFAPNFARLNSQKLCSKLLDMSFNMGLHEAVTLAQRAVNAFHLPNLKVDGVFGSETVAALNAAPEDVMIQALCVKAKEFYLALAVTKPEDSRYLNGWLARAAKIPA